MKIVNFKDILLYYNLDPESGYNMFQGERINLLRLYYSSNELRYTERYNLVQIEGLD